jgi:putative tryptophan/tyrosine transport system permease protein
MLSLLDNALLQGLSYGVAVLGLVLAFRILKYPDLTADGSFMLGAAAFAAVLGAGLGWVAALAATAAVGALLGMATATIHHVARMNRLLSGILTTMMCYSIAFRVLGGRPNVAIPGEATPLGTIAGLDRSMGWAGFEVHPAMLATLIACVLLVVLGLWFLLGSEWGLGLRASGGRPELAIRMGLRPHRFVVAGLALANVLVAASGALISARQGFMDVNMGVGIVIILIASMVLGEEILLRVSPALMRRGTIGRLVAAVLGTCLYYLLYLTVLRASIRGWIPLDVRPTDLKLVSAVAVVGVMLWRARRPGASVEDPIMNNT